MKESVQVALKGGKLAAKIPYANGEGPIQAKSIRGRKWNPEGKFWTFDLKVENYEALMNKIAPNLGMEFHSSPKSKNWYETALAEREANVFDQFSEELVDLPMVRENLPNAWEAMKNRPFQTVGVSFGLAKRSFILGDDQGLGKTLQTIALLEEANVVDPILIVTNKSAANITWPNEIRKWDDFGEANVFGAHIPPAKRSVWFENVRKKAANGRRQYVITNPAWIQLKLELDSFGKFVRDSKGVKIISARQLDFFEMNWGAVIADESQETLSCSTGNAKKWSQQRVGMQAVGEIAEANNGLKISISGTPLRGKPTNAYGQLNWLRPKEYTSFWRWAEENFVITEEAYNRAGDTAKEIGDLVNPDEFHRKMRDVMIRRLKKDVAADLPPKEYAGYPHPEGDVVGIWLDMLPDQKKQYDKFVKEQVLDGSSGEELSATNFLSISTRLRQLAESAADVGTQMVPIPELDEDGNKIKMPNGRYRYLLDEDGKKLLQPEQVLVPRFPSNKYEWLLEWLQERDLLGSGAKGTGKVIIANQFRKNIELMRKDLQDRGTNSFAITGGTKAEARVRQQDEFQNNPDSPKIFFIQSVAGGTSLTLDQADDVIIFNEMWNPDIQTQIEDRAHRLSRVHNVRIWKLRSLGTIEENIGVTTKERENTVRKVLNGEVIESLLKK